MHNDKQIKKSETTTRPITTSTVTTFNADFQTAVRDAFNVEEHQRPNFNVSTDFFFAHPAKTALVTVRFETETLFLTGNFRVTEIESGSLEVATEGNAPFLLEAFTSGVVERNNARFKWNA